MRLSTEPEMNNNTKKRRTIINRDRKRKEWNETQNYLIVLHYGMYIRFLSPTPPENPPFPS